MHDRAVQRRADRLRGHVPTRLRRRHEQRAPHGVQARHFVRVRHARRRGPLRRLPAGRLARERHRHFRSEAGAGLHRGALHLAPSRRRSRVHLLSQGKRRQHDDAGRPGPGLHRGSPSPARRRHHPGGVAQLPRNRSQGGANRRRAGRDGLFRHEPAGQYVDPQRGARGPGRDRPSRRRALHQLPGRDDRAPGRRFAGRGRRLLPPAGRGNYSSHVRPKRGTRRHSGRSLSGRGDSPQRGCRHDRGWGRIRGRIPPLPCQGPGHRGGR